MVSEDADMGVSENRMLLDRIYKPALVERATPVHAVTLRSWHRKGYTNDMGFSLHSYKLYSFADMCMFSLAAELDQLGVPMPEALRLALCFTDDVVRLIHSPEPAGLNKVFGTGPSLQINRHWKGFGIIYRTGRGARHIEFLSSLNATHIDMTFLSYAARGAVVVDVGRVCQDTADRLLEALAED